MEFLLVGMGICIGFVVATVTFLWIANRAKSKPEDVAELKQYWKHTIILTKEKNAILRDIADSLDAGKEKG